MKKLVLIVSMFSVLAATHSALACANSGADRNASTALAKAKAQATASAALGRTSVR